MPVSCPQSLPLHCPHQLYNTTSHLCDHTVTTSGVSIEAATGKFRHLLFVSNFIWVVTAIYYLINIESWYAGNGISGLLDSIIIIFLRKHAPRPLLGGGTLGPWSVTDIYLILFPTYSRFLPLTKPSHSWCTEKLTCYNDNHH